MTWLSKLAFWRGTTPTLPPEQERSEPTVVFLATGHGRPVRTTWTEAKAIREGLKISSWVYSAAMKRAEQVMEAVPVIQTRGSDGRWTNEPDPGRDTEFIQRLLDRPNPDQTWQDLMVLASLSLDLAGNSLQTMVLGAGRTASSGEVPVALWPIPSDALRPIVPEIRNDHPNEVTHYRTMQGHRQGKEILADLIVHARNPDPSNPYWGFSRLEACAVAVDTDVESAATNRSIMKNAVAPSGALGIENAGMSPDELDKVREAFDGKYKGSANAGKAVLLQGKVTWNPFSISPEKLMVLTGRKFSREEIWSVFGLPPILGGDYSSATYNNINEALRIFWTLEILPALGRIYSALNHRLRPFLPRNTRLWYSTDHLDFLRQISTEQVDAAEKLHGMGVGLDQLNDRFGWGFTIDSDNNLQRGGRP